MLLDYTERVERLHRGNAQSKLALDVANYVQHHISDAISAEDIACALYVSRPYLSKKFKEETGESLTDFILKEKTEEAKRLLRYSDKTAPILAFRPRATFPGCLRNTRAMAPESIGKNTVNPKDANLPFSGGIVGTNAANANKNNNSSHCPASPQMIQWF